MKISFRTISHCNAENKKEPPWGGSFLFMLEFDQGTVGFYRMDLPRDHFSACRQCTFYGLYNFAAARNFHTHNRNALNIVLRKNRGEFFRIRSAVKLRTRNQCNPIADEPIVKVCIRVCSTVGSNQEMCAVKIWCIDRNK